jgi:hypothetical protein
VLPPRRMTRPALAGLLVALTALVACSSDNVGSSEPVPSSPGARRPAPADPASQTTEEAAASLEEERQLQGLPAAKPTDGPVSARPTPQAKPRACEAMITRPYELRRSYLVPTTNRIQLGFAVQDDRPFPRTWVTGMPTPSALGAAVASGAGADLSFDFTEGVGLHHNYAVRVDRKAVTLRWADLHKASASRLVYGVYDKVATNMVTLRDAKRAPGAPVEPNAEWVESLSAARVFAFALLMDFPTECSLEEVADVLGRSPVLLERTGADRTVLDPAKREALEKILVRNGVQVHASLLVTRPVPAARKVLEDTRCNSFDLGACAKLVEDMSTLAASLPSAAPAYEDLIANRDPNWAVTRFARGSMGYMR